MVAALLAYDADGEVVATLDYVVQYDDDGTPLGIVDFEAHEKAGGRLRDVWDVQEATASGTWPEWIGGRAHDFKVEITGNGRNARITALVHKKSGHRRERAVIAAAIDARVKDKQDEAKGKTYKGPDGKDYTPAPEPADIRDIVGGPTKHLHLDDDGKTIVRDKGTKTTPDLPLIAPPPALEG